MDNQKDALIDAAATEMAAKMENEFSAALDAIAPGWTLDDVRRRCSTVIVAGSPIETFCLDGKPLLEIHPLETELVPNGDSWTFRCSRSIRRLYSASNQNEKQP